MTGKQVAKTPPRVCGRTQPISILGNPGMAMLTCDRPLGHDGVHHEFRPPDREFTWEQDGLDTMRLKELMP